MVPVTEAERARMDAGNAFEARIFAALQAANESCVVVDAAPRPEVQNATTQAMGGTAAMVLGGDLPDDLDGRRTGRPDVLVRVGEAPDGVGSSWVPVDVKHHRLTNPSDGSSLRWSPLEDIDPEGARVAEGIGFRRDKLADDALQLAHYWRMLEHLAAAPLSGGPVGGIIDRDQRVWWIDLAEARWRLWWSGRLVSSLEWYDHEFAFRLDVIAHTILRNSDARLDRKVEPVSTSECKACPWRAACRTELEASDHVSLLPRSTYAQFVEHRRRGAVTRRAVAALDPATAWIMYGSASGATRVDVSSLLESAQHAPPESPIGAAIDKRKKLAIRRLAKIGVITVEDLARIDPATAAYGDAHVGHLPTMIDQARAAVAGIPHRRRGTERVVVRRADVEIDVDMESCEDGVYLWGGGTGGRTDPHLGYQPFVTWDRLNPEREAAVFSEFWSWLMEARDTAHARGRSFAAYYYTAAETTQMLRILASGQPGLPEAHDLQAFITSDEWVDLNSVFRAQIVTGHGTGLKEVAPLAGFEWRDQGAGGDQSMVWYDRAVNDPDRVVRTESRNRLLRYNEDDVKATATLRRWLDGQASALPSVGLAYDEPPRRPLRPGHAGKSPKPDASPAAPVPLKPMPTRRGERESDAAVQLSRSTIRENATRFSHAFREASRENAERQSFWIRFFEVFGVAQEQVAAFELLADRASTGSYGWIDLLYPGQMGVEHKSLGEDLDQAMGQLLDYYVGLTPAEQPWLLIACDFQTFKWHNLSTNDHGTFSLAELPDNLDLFWWIAGYGRPQERFENEEEANLAATALLKVIHDHLSDNGYGGHPIREWLTRILFCLFADDTGVWDRAAFHTYVALHSRADGSDLGAIIETIFQVLNTAPGRRPQHLDEDLAQFIYVNGDLFEERLPIPFCDAATRDALLDACRFEWSIISPAIFGSLFQNVTVAADRRQLGAHYTTEENILRTIRPLFLDGLEADLRAATTKPRLRSFLDRLATLIFFDPACGCGNFLVISYREIRRLETEALRRLHALEAQDRRRVTTQRRSGQLSIDVTLELNVRVDQFYGIELEEFPAKIARTALYLADHLANREVSAEFGQHYVRFPIPASPHITIGNALQMDWSTVLLPERCAYLLGNPPFGGHATRSLAQSDDLRLVWETGYAKWLDYVTGWYRKARDYVSDHPIRTAFVSTNSIAQGEQVARLWECLLVDGFKIDFAHQTFAWTSEARGRAHVHVVIVGFSKTPPAPRRLFTYATTSADPVERAAGNISPYLVEGPDTTVAGRSTPLSPNMPAADYGSLPSDGGGLIVATEELPTDDRVAMAYIRPYLGSRELVRGVDRFCIWMPNGPAPGDLGRSRFLRERLERVRLARLASRNPDSQDLAAQPYKFFHNAQPTTAYIGIPAQVSETRRWYTVAHLPPDTIASNTLYTAEDPDGFLFGLLSSTMFITWVASIGGQLKSDLRFSKSVVHNTFPLPPVIGDRRRQAVITAGLDLLDARSNHPGASLANLYEPLATPPDVVTAHAAIDRAVDAIFDHRRRRWAPEDRLALLLDRYTILIAEGQLIAAATTQPQAASARRSRISE